MTREDALWIMQMCRDRDARSEEEREAYDTAIEALEKATINCVHCSRYYETEDDTGVHSHCRAVEREQLSFENDTKIKSCSKDSDLISRAEAIEAIELVDWYHQNRNKDMVSGANSDEHQAWYKADDVYKALEAVPSAGRPRGEWMPVSEKPKDEKRTYLVQLDGGGMCSCRWTNVNLIWTDLTTEWHWNILDTPQYSKVVAWMDLEPYKGGEDK